MTAAECQKRIDSFIEVTKTDEAFAQSVLQDHDWNLETALNAFLVSSVPSDGPKEEDGKKQLQFTIIFLKIEFLSVLFFRKFY